MTAVTRRGRMMSYIADGSRVQRHINATEFALMIGAHNAFIGNAHQANGLVGKYT